MAKCKAKYGEQLCVAYDNGNCSSLRCMFDTPTANATIPTPAELAQQLADLIGLDVAIFQESDDSWWIDTGDGANLMYLSFVIKPDGHWVKFKTAIKLNRPVSYTGRWQDSKVTATPHEVKP